MKEHSNYLVLTKHRAIKEELSYALCMAREGV